MYIVPFLTFLCFFLFAKKKKENTLLKFIEQYIYLSMTNTTCKECSHPVEGKFCSNCGQSTNIHRIDANYFLHDIPHSILHVDKGFPYTFWHLIKSPSKSLEGYLDGKRAKFFRPLAYVALMSAISSVLINWIRVAISNLYERKTGKEVVEHPSFFAHYQSVFIFIMIPLVSLCTWLVFKRCRYNFWEHLLLNTYLAAQLNVLLVLIQLFSLINLWLSSSPNYFLTFFLTGFMTYYAVTFSGLMHKYIGGWKLGLRLGLMCFVLASIYATGMTLAGMISFIKI